MIRFQRSRKRVVFDLTSTLAGTENDPVSAVKVATRFVQTFNSTYNPNFSNGALGPKFAQAAAHRGITIWPYTIDGKGYANTYFLNCISGITTNYSQYYTDCLRSVKTSETAYVIEDRAGLEAIKVLGKTYARVESEVKKTQLVILDGDNVFTLDENGIIRASAVGTATVMIGVEGKSPTGSAYTIPTPVKDGDTFIGWYENNNATGAALTVLPVGYKGTVYAIWKSMNVGTSLENVRPALDINAPMYDVLGRQVDATYRGIIIQNGHKYLLR